MIASLSRELEGAAARERPARGDRRALDRERLNDALGQLDPLLRRRAERGQAIREGAARRALGLQQRAQREQVVRQGLTRAGAFAPQLVALERPRELVALGGAAGDEAAERAKLVL